MESFASDLGSEVRVTERGAQSQNSLPPKSPSASHKMSRFFRDAQVSMVASLASNNLCALWLVRCTSVGFGSRKGDFVDLLSVSDEGGLQAIHMGILYSHFDRCRLSIRTYASVTNLTSHWFARH